MRTAGVDLSASKQRTAAAAIEWGRDCATVVETKLGLDDDELVERLGDAEWVGIDAPFGWPEAMVEAIHDYATTGRWSGIDKTDFRFRRTDRFVNETVLEETGKKLWPLSVSADRLALTAWRTAQLRERAFEGSGVRFDRAGADRTVEVYPAAALLLWGIERRPYKTSRDPERRGEEGSARAELLAAIEAKAPWLRWAEGTREACVDGRRRPRRRPRRPDRPRRGARAHRACPKTATSSWPAAKAGSTCRSKGSLPELLR